MLTEIHDVKLSLIRKICSSNCDKMAFCNPADREDFLTLPAPLPWLAVSVSAAVAKVCTPGMPGNRSQRSMYQEKNVEIGPKKIFEKKENRRTVLHFSYFCKFSETAKINPEP